MSLYTGNWMPLGDDVFYRKIELFALNWCQQYGINLSEFNISVSRFGGPIVLTKCESKSKTGVVDHDAYVFTPAGHIISTIKGVTKDASVISWTSSEDLLSVRKDGHVSVYTLYGTPKQNFYLDQEIKDTKIIECKEFTSAQGTGLAVLTSTFRFFTVNSIYDPKVRRLAEVPGLDSAPNCWAVLSQTARETQIVVANDSSLYLLSARDKTCTLLNVNFNTPYTSILKMSVSFDSLLIALFADNGCLWLGQLKSGQLEKSCEFNTKGKVAPEQLVWAGPRAVVGLWKTVLLAVGLENDWFNYNIDTPVHLAEEVDGVRIIGHDTHDFLQHIPEITVDIFRIGSISAGTLLVEASKEFDRRTHKADEYIKMLRDRHEIELAVEQCIEAAGHEYRPSDQKMLLRAACFGKCFVADNNRDFFVQMCQTLRVLNNVREALVAIPLTYQELEFLSLKVLLDRLILRRQYTLAIKVAEYMKLPEDEGSLRILGNWASNKVQEFHLDDDKVATIIFNKLGLTPGISYSDVANEAIKQGRKQLAIRLLDHETRASQQVPLLLLLDQDKKALTRAIESGDTHLIYTVIYRLRDSMSAREFSMMIRNFPTAYALYQNLCKEEDPEKLKDLYYQEDDFNAEATCWIVKAFNSERIDERLSCLRSAMESFKKARNDFAAAQTEEQLKLLKYQEKLKKTIRLDCMDDSVQKTMEKLLVAKEFKLAEDLKKEFKVSDKRFWWLKITVLANESEWIELEKFCKAKKSPIGFEPFADVCIRAGNRFEAQKYATKVLDENKIRYLVKVGMFEEAAKYAIDTRDNAGLDFVASKAPPSQKHKIDALRQQQAGPRR